MTAISSSPAAASAPRASLRAAAWPASAALLVGAVHLALASKLSAPIIMADEYGYLGAARRIVGDAPQTHVPYHAGVGLLYVPAALLGDGPLGVYEAALATNAALAVLLVLAAWWTAGLLQPLRDPRPRFAVACTVGLYTSFVGYSGLAAPEVAFAALELALVGVFARAVQSGRAAWWAVAGAGCAAAWLLHPRGAAVIGAGLLVGVLALRPVARHLRSIAAFVVPLAVGLPLITWLDGRVSGTVFDPEQYSSGALLTAVTSGHGIRLMLITALGQIFYLNAAMFGLVTLGALELGRRLRTAPDGLTVVFPLAALAGIYVMSVATFSRALRADQLLYGRYDEGAIAFLLIAAAGAIVATDADSLRRRYLTIAGGITLASAVAFYGIAGSGRLHGQYFLVTVLGIDPIRRRIGWPDPLLIGAAVFTLIYLLTAARRLGRLVPIGLVALLFLVFAVKNTREYFQPESRARGEEHVLADVLNRIAWQGAIGCVAYDRTTGSLFHFPNYRLFAPLRYVPFTPRQAEPCGDLVISGGRIPALNPGVRMVAAETRVRQALWVYPGARQDRLAAQGLLLPADPAALAAVAHAEVTARVTGSGPAGDVIRVELRATGTTPLPSRVNIAWPGSAIVVTAAWDDAESVAVADLPRMLFPGDRVTLSLVVPRIKVGKPLTPGQHELVVTVRVGRDPITSTRLAAGVP